MITKEKLREVIGEWIKSMCQECEGTGGFWISGSFAGLFYWHLNNGSSRRNRVISARLCYDQNSHHTGYIIYLNTDDDHPVIKIEGDYLIDYISNDNIHNFKKEWLYDLINRIKQAMGQNISKPEIHNDLPVILQQVEKIICDWFYRKGEKNVEIKKAFDTDGFIRINWISRIMPIELRSSYNHKHEFVGYDIFGGKPISEYPFILMRSDNIFKGFMLSPIFEKGFMLSPIFERCMSPFLEKYMYEIFEMIKQAVYIKQDQIQKQITRQTTRDSEDFISRSKALNIKSFRTELMNHEVQPTVRKSKEYEEQQTLMKFAREIRKIVEEEETMKQPEIKKFFYSGQTTVVIWDDGTKTMSSPSGDEMFDPEMGLAMAVAKKYFGNRHKFEKIVADGLYGKYLDDYKKMFVDKWTKNLKKKNNDEKIQAYTKALDALIDVKNNIRKHIDEELKKHEVDKNEFKKKLDEYEEAIKAGKKPKRPVLNSHRTPEMKDLQVRLKAVKDLITLIEQRITNLGG